MELSRKPNIREKQILEYLVKKSSLILPVNWVDHLLVKPMNDGEMGSLYLFPKGDIVENRTFGKQVSEMQFLDSDGVEVIASLNLDQKGDLFELDIWKTNFSKLIEIPDIDREVL